MQVSQVMTRKIHAISPDTGFSDIVRLLTTYRISGVPVLDNQQNLIGVVSEKDLLGHLFPDQSEFYRDPHYYWDHQRLEDEAHHIIDLRASDLMSTNVITVGPDDHIMRACALLLVHKIRRLPVVNHHKLVGIVTTKKIYRNFLQYLLEGRGD